MKHFSKSVKSPVGELTLIANEQALVALLWPGDSPRRLKITELEKESNHPILRRAEKQLAEYFAGKRTSFEMEFEFYGTDFQKKVWKALSKIPYGKTRTYLDIAKQLKSPKACRAVGAANGKNPLSIMIPCHRVIGASGKLTGFSGGLPAKKFLLELEAR